MNPPDISAKDDAELTKLANEDLGRVLAPSVGLAYRSACAYLGRKPTGKGRRRVIVEAQGKLRRLQLHAATVAQALAAKARREQDRKERAA